jgi:hypothetical protein
VTTVLLSDRDVATHLGISWQQVQKRCRSGQWPHLRIGRRYLFKAEHIEQITALCERKPAEITAAATWGFKTRGQRAS